MIAIPNERLRERAHEKVMGLELAITQTAFADSRAELEEELELARIALASLEAEPAIHRWRRVTVEPYGPYPWHYGNFIGFSKPVDGIEDEYYYSAPPAPVSVPDYPETLPCPVMLEPGLRFGKGVHTKTVLDALQRRAEYHAELEAMTPEQRAEHDAGMKEFAAMLQGGKP